MTDNIINMPTPMNVLAEKIRAAYARTEHGKREWVEGTIELAAAFADARSRFPAHQQFRHWIADAELDFINHQDRAALISMADDLDLARIVLEETERTSWQHIWDQEMKARFTHVSKTTLEPTLIPNPQPEPATEAKVENQEPSELKKHVRIIRTYPQNQIHFQIPSPSPLQRQKWRTKNLQRRRSRQRAQSRNRKLAFDLPKDALDVANCAGTE